MTEPKPSASGRHVKFAMDDKKEDTKIGEAGAEPGDVDVESGPEGDDVAVIAEVVQVVDEITGTVVLGHGQDPQTEGVVNVGSGQVANALDEVHLVDESGNASVQGLFHDPESEETQVRERSASRGRRLARLLRRHEEQAVRDQAFDWEGFWKCSFAILGLTLFLLLVYLYYYVF